MKIIRKQTFAKEDQKVIQVKISFTKEQHEVIRNYAQAAMMTPPNWIRYKIFESRFPAIKLSPVDAKLYCELQRIGISLNTAVNQLQAGKYPNPFLSILRELLTTQKDILNCLLG